MLKVAETFIRSNEEYFVVGNIQMSIRTVSVGKFQVKHGDWMSWHLEVY